MDVKTTFTQEVVAETQVPDAPYYVICEDLFLGSFGVSGTKAPWLVVPCTRIEQVIQFKWYFDSLLYFTNVKILHKAPNLDLEHKAWQLWIPEPEQESK